ncbi:2-isopropylmalate synthase [Streptomyces sp. BI20]|uniref:2-isopropylmalate synthase n=1 Tax=Streptomyces sp. BI20 TaxID=3403460 RepID=UPI003C758652
MAEPDFRTPERPHAAAQTGDEHTADPADPDRRADRPAAADPDPVRASARAGRVVLWEESARDGAQAKTLMSAEFRIRLARAHGALFGADGPRHVVFAAGFPAVGPQEWEAVRRVADEAAGSVAVAAVCRSAEPDVRQALAAVRGSAGARIMIVVPASEAMAATMLHRTAREALELALDLLKSAKDRHPEIAVDLCLADGLRADVGLVAAHAQRATEAGAGVVVLADTVGDRLPGQISALFGAVGGRVDDEVVLASHLHNDLGLGLANTLAALHKGVRVLSSSWLGLAERSGMVATEQLMFLLTQRAADLLDTGFEPWWTTPDLTGLPAIAHMVSEHTATPLTVTTPIVGTGVGTLSTGTPFVRPELFQPFDPLAVLGITPQPVLTHLASARVVTAVAARLGHRLDGPQARAAMRWVKDEAYRSGRALVPDRLFAGWLAGLAAGEDEESPRS